MSIVDLIETKNGFSSIVGELLAGGAIYTHQIALGGSAYSFGSALLYVPNSAAAHKRNNSHIVFSRDVVDCVAQSSEQNSITLLAYAPQGLAYTFTNWSHKGYFYSDDATLSNSFFNDGSASSIRVHSARINGSSLELAFKNMSVGTSILNLEIEYRVFQVHNKA